jgi:16S rRNA (uracil1498-N3)-methyltransferase
VCASRREKIEWIIQKCTEIGAASFRLLVSERSLVQKIEDIQQKQDRWQQIAMEAAEQSGRVHVPEILLPLHIQQALSLPSGADTLKCIAWELDRQHTIDQLLQQIIPPQKVILVIGPEGGLSDTEVQFALDNGFHAITLGNRIFRLETAAIVGCVLMLNAFHTL